MSDPCEGRIPAVGPPEPPTGTRAGGEALVVVLVVALPPLLLPALGLLSAILGVGAATAFLYRAGQRWADLGLVRRPAWRRVIAQGFGLYVLVAASVSLALLPLLRQAGFGTPDISTFSGLEGNLMAWLTTLIFSWIMAAFGEEMIARGFLLDRFSRIFGPGRGGMALAVVLQAGLFGLAHAYQGPAGMLLTGFVGMVLALGYLATGRNLWVVIIAHGIINSVSLTAVFLGVSPT